jgi:hypothetical protein
MMHMNMLRQSLIGAARIRGAALTALPMRFRSYGNLSD